MKNRFLASIVLATFLLSVLNISGCKPEVIEDYPVPVVSDASDVSVQIDSTTMEDSDALEFDADE